LAHPTKNHVAASCTNANIPDTKNSIYSRKFDGITLIDPTTQSDWETGSLLTLPIHTNGKIDCRGFQVSPKFCENTDKALATYCFTIPNSWNKGFRSFQWQWQFNVGEFYTTCWEAQIVSHDSRNLHYGLIGTIGQDLCIGNPDCVCQNPYIQLTSNQTNSITTSIPTKSPTSSSSSMPSSSPSSMPSSSPSSSPLSMPSSMPSSSPLSMPSSSPLSMPSSSPLSMPSSSPSSSPLSMPSSSSSSSPSSSPLSSPSSSPSSMPSSSPLSSPSSSPLSMPSSSSSSSPLSSPSSMPSSSPSSSPSSMPSSMPHIVSNKKCIWDVDCNSGCSNGLTCEQFNGWSQCLEINIPTIDCIGTNHWGCAKQSECCNSEAICYVDNKCWLPCMISRGY